MDKRITGALGGVSALALLSTAAAAAPTSDAPAPLQPAQSFGELLDPIPNAVSVLKAEDAKAADGQVELAQYYERDDGYYHHHHHHHHHHWRHYEPVVPGFGFYGRRYHHHHHHHHHHQYYRQDEY